MQSTVSESYETTRRSDSVWGRQRCKGRICKNQNELAAMSAVTRARCQPRRWRRASGSRGQVLSSPKMISVIRISLAVELANNANVDHRKWQRQRRVFAWSYLYCKLCGHWQHDNVLDSRSLAELDAPSHEQTNFVKALTLVYLPVIL